MIFLLLTKLPRAPQSFQWLISIMKSLGDPLCISHFIFTHSKESAIPWVYPAHTGQSLLYSLACSCCLPLLQAAQLAWYFFFFFPAAYTKTGTSMHISQLPGPLPEQLCHLQWCPCHCLSSAALGSLPLFFIAFCRIEVMKPDPLRAR